MSCKFCFNHFFKTNFPQHLKQFLNRHNDFNLVLSRLIQQTAGIFGLL